MIRKTVVDSLLHRMADAASMMLDSFERDFVCGDLAESGESGSQALRDVLSLLIRRRANCLRGWRPWLTVVGLTIPLSVLVSLQSRRIADGTALYLWFFVNNSDWTIIHSSAFWRNVAQFAPGALLSCLVLGCWAWTTGLLVGCFARRILWFSGTIFFAASLAVGVFGIPHFFDFILVQQRVRDFHDNAAVFLVTFYRELFPQCLQLILVVLPAWRGMLQGCRIDRFPRFAQVLLLMAATAAIGSLMSTNLLWWQMRVWHIWPLRQPRLPSLMPLAIAGPAAYLLLAPLVRRARAFASQS